MKAPILIDLSHVVKGIKRHVWENHCIKDSSICVQEKLALCLFPVWQLLMANDITAYHKGMLGKVLWCFYVYTCMRCIRVKQLAWNWYTAGHSASRSNTIWFFKPCVTPLYACYNGATIAFKTMQVTSFHWWQPCCGFAGVAAILANKCNQHVLHFTSISRIRSHSLQYPICAGYLSSQAQKDITSVMFT